jgi:hypothetical protein
VELWTLNTTGICLENSIRAMKRLNTLGLILEEGGSDLFYLKNS